MLLKLIFHGYVVKKIVFQVTILFISFQILAHNDPAYNHESSDLLSRADWMARISNDQKLLRISLPGTHDSGAMHGGDIIATQSHTISQQLHGGIRFLDIRARQIKDSFFIYHGIANQHLTFNEVLDAIQNFLKEHKTETVLVRIKQEESAIDSKHTFAQTMQSYVDDYPDLFLINANIYTKLEQARGKAVILRDFSILYGDSNFGIRYGRGNFDIQDAYTLSNNWTLYDKWQKVKREIDNANNYHGYKGFINYLSASTGSLPYFVAGGRSSHQTNAPRLFTGYFKYRNSDKYPDFPKLKCIASVCAIFFDGINDLTRQYLEANKDTLNYVGIMPADFPGTGLIDAIIAVNF